MSIKTIYDLSYLLKREDGLYIGRARSTRSKMKYCYTWRREEAHRFEVNEGLHVLIHVIPRAECCLWSLDSIPAEEAGAGQAAEIV